MNSSKPYPPHWLRWLLSRLHPNETLEEVEGDLDELYVYWYQRAGQTQAILRYLLNVLSVLPPFVRRRQPNKDYYQHTSALHPAMLQNHFTIAWRTITRNRFYFLLNMVGLSTGMAAGLFIMQFVNFEWSYDQFNTNARDLYRVVNDRYQDGKLVQHSTMTYSAIGKALQTDYPEVVNHTRVAQLSSRILSTNQQKIGGQNGLAVDASFFSMFSYPLTAEQPDQVLKEPNQIILSQTCARKLFGDEGDFSSMVGRLIKLEQDATPYKVTGICRDAPANSHLHFDFMLSYPSLYSGANQYWKAADYSFTEAYFWHYIQLRPGTDHKTLEAKFPGFSQRHFKETNSTGRREQFYLQPLLEAHLYSDFGSEIGKTGSATIVWGALISALLILTIAWINYVNLTTARAIERAKEVGVRKSSGATKRQLVVQFFIESLVANGSAILLAACLVYGFQGWFNQLIGQELSVGLLVQKGLYGNAILVVSLLVILVGVFGTGVYPALVLSSFKPALVMKGVINPSAKGIFVRKALVVGQFAVTIALIMSAIVVYQQIHYTAQKKLGLTLSQVLIISPPQLIRDDSSFITKERSFKEELKKLAHVRVATNSSRVPGEDLHRLFDVYRPDSRSSPRVTLNNMSVGEEFIDLYEIKLQVGRNFRPTDYHYDLGKVRTALLNESATRLLGFSSGREAVGKSVMLYEKPYEIIGIVRNFHQKSLHQPIEPTVMLPNYSLHNPISVKVDTRDLASTLATIQLIYDRFFPGNVFAYHFLDDKFNDQYNNDRLTGKIVVFFSGFAILIASLGLLGLSWLATLQRTKEIGIRKVLGASVSSLLVLLARDFLKMVLISLLLASPLAWWAMNSWLKNFAYRIDIEWWMFALAGFLALAIALLTISFQSIKAALMNPVKSLRSE